MVQSRATSVNEYLATLPADRRAALEAVREVFRTHLDPAIEEGMQYGMIGYFIPHRVYPAGYHCDPKQPLPYAGLAAQKNYMSIYLMCLYGSPEQDAWFRAAWEATGRKLDKGKACIRFRTLDDVALDVLAGALRRVPSRAYIAEYEALLARTSKGRAAARKGAVGTVKAKTAGTKTTRKTASTTMKPAGEKPGAKKAAAKKAAAKKAAAKKAAAKKVAAKKARKTPTAKKQATPKAKPAASRRRRQRIREDG